MPNRRTSNGSMGSPTLRMGHTDFWTDDIPVCPLSGVGFSTNQIYREDGNRREEHEFEDRSFHFHSNNLFLYGVFDGHDGSKAANFAAQKMPAELLLDQLVGKASDDEIKEVLHQAFIAVEKGFFESIDDILAERTNLQLQLPEGMNQYDVYTQYADVMDKIQALDAQISGGTTAIVSLIYNAKLYVANVGDSRALLCKLESDNVLHVKQLTVDHSISDSNEQIRLAELGIDIQRLLGHRKLGNSENTRCIGDYRVKGGYKDIDILSAAASEPVIAEPDIHDGISIDGICGFLVLMSDGMYQALEDATGCPQVNADIARMIAQEFAVQTTLIGVCQAVIDKVVRIHHDNFMTGSQDMKQRCQKRGDITLLVRNFSYSLATSVSPSSGAPQQYLPVSVPFYGGRSNAPTNINISGMSPLSPYRRPQSSESTHSTSSSDMLTPVPDSNRPSSGGYLTSTLDQEAETNNSTNSTQSSDSRSIRQKYKSKKLELDEDGKIEAYVDFSDFCKVLDELPESERENLNLANTDQITEDVPLEESLESQPEDSSVA